MSTRGMTSLGSGDATKASMSNRQPGEHVTDGQTIRLVGGEGSPYSNKMKALLTYRRIPFRWLVGGVESMGTAEAPGPVLAPKIVFPDDSVMNDSTFLIKELEARFEGRSVVPTDPRLAFLVSLVEDFGDEWVTKAMYQTSPSPHPLPLPLLLRGLTRSAAGSTIGGRTTSRMRASASAHPAASTLASNR